MSLQFCDNQTKTKEPTHKNIPQQLHFIKNIPNSEYGLCKYTKQKQNQNFNNYPKQKNSNITKLIHRSKSGVTLSHQRAILIQKLYQETDFKKIQKLNEENQKIENKNKRNKSSSSRFQTQLTKASSPALTNNTESHQSIVFDVKDLKREIQKQEVIESYYQVFQVRPKKNQNQIKSGLTQIMNQEQQYYQIKVCDKKKRLKLTIKDTITKK